MVGSSEFFSTCESQHCLVNNLLFFLHYYYFPLLHSVFQKSVSFSPSPSFSSLQSYTFPIMSLAKDTLYASISRGQWGIFALTNMRVSKRSISETGITKQFHKQKTSNSIKKITLLYFASSGRGCVGSS